MASLYIASSLSNWERVKRLQQEFISRGVDISYDWTPHAVELKEFSGDDEHKKYLKIAANGELAGVLSADHLLAIMPGGRGTHFEMGAMHVKQAILSNGTFQRMNSITLLDDADDAKFPTSFHFLTGITRVTSEVEAIEHVMQCLSDCVA